MPRKLDAAKMGKALRGLKTVSEAELVEALKGKTDAELADRLESWLVGLNGGSVLDYVLREVLRRLRKEP